MTRVWAYSYGAMPMPSVILEVSRKRLKIDNLKAAIVEANFYETTVQRNYAALAEYEEA